MGAFDDLIPSDSKPVGGAFDDLIPKKQETKKPEFDVQRDILSHTTPSFAEPIGAGAMGMIAPTIGAGAGLLSMPLHAMGMMKTDPQQVRENVERYLTPEPQTAIGKLGTKALSIPGEIFGAGGKKIEEAFEPPPGAFGLGAEVQRGAARAAGEAFRQAPGVAGAAIGGRMAGKIPEKQAALNVERGENLPKDINRQTFRDAGYITPPESGIKAAAAGLAGKAKTEKILSEPNEINATRRLGKEVGAPEGTALTPEEFTRLKESAGEGYDAIVRGAGPELKVTPEFEIGLKDTYSKINSLLAYNSETYSGLIPAQRLIKSYMKKIEAPEVAPPMKGVQPIMRTLANVAKEQPGPRIARTLETAAADSPFHLGIPEARATPTPTPRSATMSTGATFKAIQDLRRYAKEDFNKQNSDMGTARLGIANLMENMIEDNLARTGQQSLVDQFRQSRERFAKIYLLERVTNDATGRVNLPKLASLSDTKAYKGVLTGEFKTAADFAKTFRKAAQKSTGEAAPRFTVFDGMFAVGSMMGGHPWLGALELGGRYAIPKAAEAGMLQNKTPSYQASQLPPQLARILGIGTTAGPPDVPMQ